MTRIFSEKLDVKWKDKYTGQIFTGKELNEGVLKPTMALGVHEVEKLIPWFERFEKI